MENWKDNLRGITDDFLCLETVALDVAVNLSPEDLKDILTCQKEIIERILRELK